MVASITSNVERIPRRDSRLSVQIILLMLVFLLTYLEGILSERIFGASHDAGAGTSLPVRLASESLLAIALVWAAVRSRTRKLPPGSVFFLAYAAWAMIASIENGVSPFQGFLYARYTLYSLAVYFIAWNNTLRPSEVIILIRLLVKLFILQIVSSVVMLLLLREFVEWRVGTMTLAGGELATVFPLLALGFTIGWYFFVRPRWWVLLLGISFGLVGYSSGKRAIFFLLPVFFLIDVGLYFLMKRRMTAKPLPTRIVQHGLVLGLVGILVMGPAMMTTEGFADVFAENGLSLQSVAGAINFVQEYNNGVRDNGAAGGRNAASAVIFVGVVLGGPSRLLFGWGPSALGLDNESSDGTGAGFSTLNVYYGIVGWSRDAISIGLVGSFLYILAYASVFRVAFAAIKTCGANRYARMLAFGACSGIVALLVCYFIYASAFMTCGAITFVLTFCAGLVASPAQNRFRRALLRRSPQENLRQPFAGPNDYSRVGEMRIEGTSE